jgi:CubicO group peptidase (beta-lactamase class C family)
MPGMVSRLSRALSRLRRGTDLCLAAGADRSSRLALESARGRLGSERILSRPSVELMTTDQLTSEQKLGSEIFFGNNRGWGKGLSVFTERDDLCNVPGRFGWDGGYGTSWYSDPKENLTGILLTQRIMDSPQPPRAMVDFWTLAYQAIDD